MSIVTEQIFKEAADLFHQPPAMLNCSQSVMALCGRQDMVPEVKCFGGGRAPDGLCGALYAALLLVPEERHEEIKQAFAEEAGAVRCADIKNGNGTSCQMCVALATALARGK